MRIGGWSLAALGMTVNAACANFRPPPPPVAVEAAGAAPEEIWSVKAGRGITDPVVVSGSTALLAGTDRVLRAISVDDAREQWSRRLPGADSHRLEQDPRPPADRPFRRPPVDHKPHSR